MRRTTLVAVAAAGLAALPAAAQDIEALSHLSGRPLPAGYYERIRTDPGFFEHRLLWPGAGVMSETEPADPPGRRVVRGKPRMVVMMGLFADSPEPPVSAAAVHERLFGANPAGNLTDFYREMSGGRLTIEGAVLPWVRTRFTRAQAAGRSFGLGQDSQMGWYLRDILDRVDGGTDMGRFDNDGPDGVPNSGDDDGVVDLAVFQFAEPAASCDTDAIWPHRASISGWLGAAYTTDDLQPSGHPVVVNQYHIQSAVDCGGQPQTISTIAHETGHAFGLPDLYDASGGIFPFQRRWVLGCWTLMAAGAWGCGDGSAWISAPTPSHMSPQEKMWVGWLTPIVAQPGWRRAYTLRPVQTSADALLVPLRNGPEYLLLEYRTRTGYDASLAAGGVLVYHVDQSRPLRVSCNGCDRKYQVSLVEADGDGALLRTAAEGGNRGVAGDVFGGRRTLDDNTTPSLRQNSGLPSNVAVEIEVADGVARIVVSTLPVVASTRLLAPLLGTPGAPPVADEQAALDRFGNRNGRYDMGDLRAYMRSRPRTVTQGT
jgi:M6 family metalloprotease-like protein